MIARPPRVSWLALGWGALWGTVLGAWLLAPRVLEFYRIAPASFGAWCTLEALLALWFAGVGAVLGFLGSAPLVVVHAIRRGRMHDPPLAYGLGAALLVPLSYLLAAVAVEKIYPAPSVELDLSSAAAQPIVPLLAALGPSLWIAYRRLAGRGSARRLAHGLAVAAVAGLASLPLRAGKVAPIAAADPPAAAPRRDGATHAPLLFVGIDGGNWRTLRPALERGELPTLASVEARGLHGEVAAIWPPYWSAPAWAAIVTGRPRRETGIYEDLTAEVPGLPPFEVPLVVNFALDPLVASAFFLAQGNVIHLAHARREALRRPPFWETFSRAGIETAVVRFRFTYPAGGRADYVISDRVGEDLWQWAGVHSDLGPGAVWPAAEAPQLTAPFARPFVAGDFAELLGRSDRAIPRGAAKDPVEALAIALRIDQQTLWASEALLAAHPRIAAMAVYLGGFDSVCHAFWQYRFPGEFPDDPPDAADVAALGGVIERYWQFLDRGIAELVAAVPEAPNVVLVADHGVEAIHTNPLWKGWHSARGGIFLAAGPDVPRGTDALAVSYFDVLPTLSELVGLTPASGGNGTSLLHRPR